MPPSDPDIPELEPRISGLVDKAVQQVREEFLRRLQETREHFEGLMAGREPTAPAPEASPAEEVATPPTEAPAAPPPDLLADLRAAIRRIDRARRQQEILEALLEVATRFASRTALFISREEGFRGWGAAGFAAPANGLGELVFSPLGGPWQRLAQGRGGVELESDDCAEICAGIDDSRPRAGVLIPLVLRDRIAAGFYADRVEEGAPLDLAALQVLGFVTAQALETLPLKERSSTATLRLDHEAPADEAGLALWGTPAAAPEPAPEAEGALDAAAAAIEAASEMPSVDEPAALLEEAPPAGPAELEPELQPIEESGFAVEPAVEPEPTLEEALEVEAPLDEPAPVEEPTPFEEPLPEPEDEVATLGAAPTATPEPPAAAAPELVEPIVEEPTLEDLEIEEPEIEERPAPPPRPEAPPERQAAPPVAGAQVQPPADVDGPGWAFIGKPSGEGASGEARREEAQRLARLLATEIKLYNEEQVAEGRKNRNLYRLLKEDIDRSRQIYEERVDPQIREGTDYFREELIRILADGDAAALGM